VGGGHNIDAQINNIKEVSLLAIQL
jgi:hypothetical protein